MKTNLSSQIKLNRIPSQYYRPANAFDYTALTRFEKINTEIFESSNEGSVLVAEEIEELIRFRREENRYCVLAVSAGMATRGVMSNLVRLHKEKGLSFSNVVIFNISEFYPLTPETIGTAKTLHEQLIDQVDINPDLVFTPDGNIKRDSIFNFCKSYEDKIEQMGGIDIAILELGQSGRIGFNEPGSQINSVTRLMLLDNDTRAKTAILYNTQDEGAGFAITMGVSTLMKSKQIFLMAWGEEKSSLIKNTIENKISDSLPASYLQQHNNAKVILDLSAAEKLTRISSPWLVTSCEWDEKLIRRAIVWLCQLTKKPILKLTNKDYNENGLSELLALYGSAYNVNIKIFNDLQHTITGWPGGKPNADDTFRPERANPYPKRIVVFSPHPDDDVISMGGTLKRLVDQHHDVHVAYQTSGNIAVSDEDVMRYALFLEGIMDHYHVKSTEFRNKYSEVTNFLVNEKKKGDKDILDVRYVKGLIRRGEARTACDYIGVKRSNVHFLDLPFYETGTIKKGDLSEADMVIVKKLLKDVKPHQVFVAGDLADPHGTHKVCTDAVFAALDELKDEKETWLEDCRVWMYRGAWAEWEIDNIEMAVPISPEELRQKRNAILKHQSQMESAPFLGNDERLFWQRSEARNRGTAELYQSLGLASYEAIEAFVEYEI